MAPEKSKCTFRRASSVEEASALWWPLMKELGWNRSELDAETHFHVAQDGKNWIILMPNSSDRAEGCVIPFMFPNSTAWVGYFIINKDYRGQGFGAAMWKEMEVTFRANHVAIIGLDAVAEQVGTYSRRGFVDCARIHLMVRNPLKNVPFGDLDFAKDVEFKDLKSVDPKGIAEVDLEHTGLDRSAFWAPDALLSRTDAYGFAILSGSRVTGFVYVRECEHGYRVGPLIAETYTQGQQLLHKAMTHVANSDGHFVAEIFGTNTEGKKLFEDLGWTYAEVSYHRMWLNGKVPVEQQEGGKGAKSMYACFDACAG